MAGHAHTGSDEVAEMLAELHRRQDEREEAASTRERPAAHIETLAALVLSVAAVATAWSAYQATRWGGVMALNFNEAGALRQESVRVSTQTGLRTVADVTVAADWLAALLSDNFPLAEEFRARMTPELELAMSRWLGEGWQPDQPLPPGSPFDDNRYIAPGTESAAALEQEAEERFAEGRLANQRADNYVLTGVLFALALFFAGISSRAHGRANIHRLVYAATVFMVVGIILLALQPKDIGI